MKKLLVFLLTCILLSSCSPAFGGGGFIIPLGAAILCVWCAGRYFFGWGLFSIIKPEGKGSMFALICAGAMAALAIISYFVMAAN